MSDILKRIISPLSIPSVTFVATRQQHDIHMKSNDDSRVVVHSKCLLYRDRPVAVFCFSLPWAAVVGLPLHFFINSHGFSWQWPPRYP